MKSLLDLLSRSPLWAVHPEAMARFVRLIRVPAEEAAIFGDWQAAKPSMMGRTGAKVAVIPVEGVLTKDGPAWYGSNYDGISHAVETAAGDPEVKHIALVVDSPGGEVTGLPETAGVIAAAAKVKPVTSIVNGMSASAAYWLSSQARDIVLTPSGEVGSVGVRMMHMDVSRMMDGMGVTVTELSSGEFKTEWSPFKPLTEAAKEDMQARLSDTHADFLNAVATGRGNRLSDNIKSQRMGEGRMFSAKAAKEHGMVDSVMPFRDAFRAIMPPAEEHTATPFPIKRTEKHLELLRLRGKR